MIAAATGLAHSVQTRLVQHAKKLALDPNLVLSRFATERFLYRLSRSRHAEQFVLKGALLMLVWLGETVRPTRDADLLGFGDLSEQSLGEVIAEICAVAVEPDGVSFLTESIRVARIREEDAYGGLRATLDARLGNARLRVQIDVGIGDAVVPEPEWLHYPGMLDLPQARLRAYRPETAIAEKLHAMVVLGAVNSRMRDFFDVYVLSERQSFDGTLLVRAVRATFERRRTAIPDGLPLALTAEFATSEKQAQWQGFLRKNALTSVPDELGQASEHLSTFLGPVIGAAHRDASFAQGWPPGGPWRASK